MKRNVKTRAMVDWVKDGISKMKKIDDCGSRREAELIVGLMISGDPKAVD